MPLNAPSLESESKEFAFADFNDVAFDRIHDQFQTVTQESADTVFFKIVVAFFEKNYKSGGPLAAVVHPLPTVFQ